VPVSKVLGQGTPLIAWAPCLDVKLENGTSFPFSYDSPVPDWVMQDQRHAYCACTRRVRAWVRAGAIVLQ
jgi:hypothetical protein